MIRILLLALVLVFTNTLQHASFAVNATGLDHRVWDELLGQYVVSLEGGKVTQVDYEGFATKRKTLKSYLDQLETVTQEQFDQWPRDAQLAFLINAYNSWTVELILTKYPDLESIKELGSLLRSPWKKKFIPLLGDTRSLDDIEHTMIRGEGKFDDPRIHFAVNCASIGCPPLRSEAYKEEIIQHQLDEMTSLFLQDRQRNRVGEKGLELSSIFKWYREDFEKGWLGYESLEQFLIDHQADLELNKSDVAKLKEKKMKIEFLGYDWKLNKTR